MGKFLFYFLFKTTLLQTFLNSYVRKIALCVIFSRPMDHNTVLCNQQSFCTLHITPIAHCAVFSKPVGHNTVLSNSTSRGLPKLRGLWDAHTSGSTPFPYTTSRHHSSFPALRENLFPSVVLFVFLNFHWLILFPRTLILLQVKVLPLSISTIFHKNVRKHRTGAAVWWWGSRKAAGLAMFKSVCKCQTSSTSCQQERWLLFQVGKEKG